MNNNKPNMIGSAFALILVVVAAFIMQRFFLPLVWAGILCIATWPLYEWLEDWCGKRPALAALLLTLAIACVFVMPALAGLQQAIRQAPVFAQFIADANTNGIATPDALKRIPFMGDYLWQWWQATLAQPHGLTHLFSEGAVVRLHSASEILRRLGGELVQRLVDFVFAFVCLFFLYKNGRTLHLQMTRIGMRWLGELRWRRYYSTVPNAIRGTVNGLVLVGLGEGVVIGLGYAFAGLPSAALWGVATGILAIIPFGAPLAYLSAAILLAAQGSSGAALGIAAWGTMVLFVADHLVRPNVIGSATRLPFLAVLFGIFGGVEMLGLVGLFIGPVTMALVITLWREAAGEKEDGEGSVLS